MNTVNHFASWAFQLAIKEGFASNTHICGLEPCKPAVTNLKLPNLAQTATLITVVLHNLVSLKPATPTHPARAITGFAFRL
tara:strand:+ start:301 stop:543 length:243 start_codon:yes stop_codon:yes gene_type:complete